MMNKLHKKNLIVLAATPIEDSSLVVWDTETNRPYLIKVQLPENPTPWEPLPGELWTQGPIGYPEEWTIDHRYKPQVCPYPVRGMSDVMWDMWLGRTPLVWFVPMDELHIPRLPSPKGARAYIQFSKDPKYKLTEVPGHPGMRRWQLRFDQMKKEGEDDDFDKMTGKDIKDVIGIKTLGEGFSSPVRVDMKNGVSLALKQTPILQEEPVREAGFKSTIDVAKNVTDYLRHFGTYTLPFKPFATMKQFEEKWPDLAKEIIEEYEWSKYPKVPVEMMPYIAQEGYSSVPLEVFGTDQFAKMRAQFAGGKHMMASTLIGPPDRHPGNTLLIDVHKDGEYVTYLPLEIDFDFIPARGHRFRADTGAISGMLALTEADADYDTIKSAIGQDIAVGFYRYAYPDQIPRGPDIDETFFEAASMIDNWLMDYRPNYNPLEYFNEAPHILGALDALSRVEDMRQIAAKNDHDLVYDYMDLLKNAVLLDEYYDPIGRAATEWWPEVKEKLKEAGV